MEQFPHIGLNGGNMSVLSLQDVPGPQRETNTCYLNLNQSHEECIS